MQDLAEFSRLSTELSRLFSEIQTGASLRTRLLLFRVKLVGFKIDDAEIMQKYGPFSSEESRKEFEEIKQAITDFLGLTVQCRENIFAGFSTSEALIPLLLAEAKALEYSLFECIDPMRESCTKILERYTGCLLGEDELTDII